MSDEPKKSETSGESTYRDFGFEVYDTVQAVPFMVPSQDGGECLLGARVQIGNEKGEKLFQALLPTEVTLLLISNLAAVHLKHLKNLSEGSYKVDTQLVTRDGIKNSMKSLAKTAQDLSDLVDTVFVDDSEITPETDEEDI